MRAVVVLGGFGWQALLPVLATPDPAGGHPGWVVPRPRPAFGHGAHVTLAPAEPGEAAPLEVFGSYHVSQQNTFTGRLTPAMLEDVLADRRSRRRPGTDHPGTDHPGTPRRLGSPGR